MATTAIKDSRVAIVGGSIAGCAAAIALKGKVKSITIFERSMTLQIEDRGQGIGMAKPMQELFSQKGFLTKNYRFVQSKGREWFVKDDDTTSSLGRKVWTQPIPVQLHNWGLLWRDLREAVDADFRSGVEVGDCNLEGDGVELFDSAGDTLGTFDICLAADGSNSILRKKLLPDSKPNYSGYVLWRGSFPIEDGSHIPDINYFLDKDVWTTVGYPGGHMVSYAMPSTTDDRFLINWALYGKVPVMDFDTPGVVRNIPTKVLQDFLQTAEETLPPLFAQIVNVNKEEISIHPVFDESPDRFVDDSSRLLLLGDAGAILRPHTAAGTTKALQDAMALGNLCEDSQASWKDVCVKYNQERKKEADSLVKLGARLGEFQVVNTPDWANMNEQDYGEWAQTMTQGIGNYMWQKK